MASLYAYFSSGNEISVTIMYGVEMVAVVIICYIWVMLTKKSRFVLLLLAAVLLPGVTVASVHAAPSPPNMSQPLFYNFYTNQLPVMYTIPETPEPGTVQLRFVGTTTYTLTMSDTQANVYSFNLDLDNVLASPNVVSATPSATIPDGTYSWIYIAYQNAAHESAQGGAPNVTIDRVAPKLSTLSPTNGATKVNVDETLRITFNENVRLGTGKLTIRKYADGSIVEVIGVSDESMSGGGTKTITTRFSSLLAHDTVYYIEADATAFKDMAGNSFGNTLGKSVWRFTTSSTSTLEQLAKTEKTQDTATDQSAATDDKKEAKPKKSVAIKEASNRSFIASPFTWLAVIVVIGVVAAVFIKKRKSLKKKTPAGTETEAAVKPAAKTQPSSKKQ